MPKYMFLLHGEDDPTLSPAQMQSIVEEYMAWARQMRTDGNMIGGSELKSEAKVVRGTGLDMSVTDGPFPESKEAIGGYFLIEAKDDQDAVRLAGQCPGLRRGGSVEIHELIEH